MCSKIYIQAFYMKYFLSDIVCLVILDLLTSNMQKRPSFVSSTFLFSGVVMVVVILISRRLNINPDNVATPIAASLGDLVTLSLLAWVSNLLFEVRYSLIYILNISAKQPNYMPFFLAHLIYFCTELF